MAKTDKTGTTLTYWEDLKDNRRPYNMGDVFPHPEVSYEVTDARMNELASEKNKREQPLIKINEDAETVETETSNEINYDEYSVTELKALAKERKLEGYSALKRDELIILLSK